MRMSVLPTPLTRSASENLRSAGTRFWNHWGYAKNLTVTGRISTRARVRIPHPCEQPKTLPLKWECQSAPFKRANSLPVTLHRKRRHPQIFLGCNFSLPPFTFPVFIRINRQIPSQRRDSRPDPPKGKRFFGRVCRKNSMISRFATGRDTRSLGLFGR